MLLVHLLVVTPGVAPVGHMPINSAAAVVADVVDVVVVVVAVVGVHVVAVVCCSCCYCWRVAIVGVLLLCLLHGVFLDTTTATPRTPT